MINVVLLFVAHLLFSTSASAQVFNDSSVRGCSGPIQVIARDEFPINSTGTARLAHGSAREPWYVSLTITDRRQRGVVYGDSITWQQLEGFLSVPSSLAGSQRDNQTEYCMFMLPPRDPSSQEEAGDCTGVLSDECMRSLIHNTPSIRDGRCHTPSDVEEACGTNVPLVSRSPSNFSSTDCTLTGLPHIDLPEDYRTYGDLPVAVYGGGNDRENFDLYDKNVHQVVPMLFTIKSSDGTVENKAVCLAPDNVLEGSRVPESTAARSSSAHASEAALTVMAVVFLLSVA
ncbi:hypothetical protein J3E72DRAFT_378460 [Bipolaris maydis]|uniref:uncharacterized protein n=1 Tax=Cochliobolus heterostrophus TaxID=5016 RepID=UPI0024D3B334|nr:hypothetical protein J3E73DRAFT_373521 [Bipolaris maydis]KAJ5056040.1 hypothetical protein J3E74DRAFT_410738 [Bipolaris maydis]KAJ6193791.1 hypothetical protein J3E72DRAFT_378460 [Bipolaris maydis]KAJ6212085.1 hypothetical protein PSV09DRAFT_2396929 [Bipolaris maydis]KAJ6266997.1 hypothetical protein PSV08DRAFT_355501 [Bipolaris maydis]